MHGLILAGGEGSRLRADGVPVPKPLVSIGDLPQLRRLLDMFQEVGCESTTCLVRADFRQVAKLLQPGGRGGPHLVWCRTPSSLHTLVEGLRVVPPGPVFCTMIDTVMRPEDWRATYRETEGHLTAGAALVLVVTPFVDDESPLYVERDDEGMVTRIGGEPGISPLVTGGVYGLSERVREEAAAALKAGLHRMRAFLQRVVQQGHRVATVEIARIIDLDRRRDLEQADAWLRTLH